MLAGGLVTLRARRESDVPLLQAGLYDDVATRVQADSRAWRPIPPGSPASPYASSPPSTEVANFTVVLVDRTGPAADEVIGEALLRDIDLHNRSAHMGISLLSNHRRHGYGTDVVTVLCRYGFAVLGLYRLQIDTLATNNAMRAAPVTTGFVLEGTRKHAAWVDGHPVDELVYGVATG